MLSRNNILYGKANSKSDYPGIALVHGIALSQVTVEP